MKRVEKVRSIAFEVLLTPYDLEPFYNPTISCLPENHNSGAQYEKLLSIILISHMKISKIKVKVLSAMKDCWTVKFLT